MLGLAQQMINKKFKKLSIHCDKYCTPIQISLSQIDIKTMQRAVLITSCNPTLTNNKIEKGILLLFHEASNNYRVSKLGFFLSSDLITSKERNIYTNLSYLVQIWSNVVSPYRVTELDNMICKQWLNLNLEAFKLKCKDLFLKG